MSASFARQLEVGMILPALVWAIWRYHGQIWIYRSCGQQWLSVHGRSLHTCLVKPQPSGGLRIGPRKNWFVAVGWIKVYPCAIDHTIHQRITVVVRQRITASPFQTAGIAVEFLWTTSVRRIYDGDSELQTYLSGARSYHIFSLP